jgi:hypothetical protein
MGEIKRRNFFEKGIKSVCAISLLFVLSGCSKTVTPDPIVLPPTTTPPSAPSGVIQSFTIADTLVPFNKGSYVSWLVTGTNTLTIVTYQGIKVANYGSLDTGPLKQNTTFTLSVNSGAKATVSIKVADSVSTALWNEGKGLILTKTEYYGMLPTDTTTSWIDQAIDKQVADQYIHFNYNGSSNIVQLTGSQYPSPGDTGPFVVVNRQTQFIWRQVLYTIKYLDTKKLVVQFTEEKGSGAPTVWQYTYEFQ